MCWNQLASALPYHCTNQKDSSIGKGLWMSILARVNNLTRKNFLPSGQAKNIRHIGCLESPRWQQHQSPTTKTRCVSTRKFYSLILRTAQVHTAFTDLVLVTGLDKLFECQNPPCLLSLIVYMLLDEFNARIIGNPTIIIVTVHTMVRSKGAKVLR